jgi:UDP-glucose 4-epimerase
MRPAELRAAMAILVTGGAGYIGSHMVERLRRARRGVVVVDDLSAGHRSAVPRGAPFEIADVGDVRAMTEIIHRYEVDAIIHFAAKIQVGESVTNPRLYWTGNLVATARLLECALEAKVGAFILSSTAAVYGTPGVVPIAESAPTVPINPYGETKLAIEKMLASYDQAYGLRFAALRYFNAAGADVESGLSERHDPETHLIPLVLDVAGGRRDHITVFGRDYDTPDGTCVRDYIHVMDLADAHLAALEHLQGGGRSGAFNLGTGKGHSVAEVIETCRAVTGKDIRVVDGARREGDPAVLVASPSLAEKTLAWQPTRSSLERIVRDAWSVHADNTAGTNQSKSSPRARRKEGNANVR